MQKHNNLLLIRDTAEEATKERGSEEGERREKRGGSCAGNRVHTE
jgi:hypothetical protein